MSIKFPLAVVGLAALLAAMGCGRDPLGELVGQLKSPKVETRRDAARSLGKVPQLDAPTVAALTVAVADMDAEVRRLSAVALGHAGAAAASSIADLESALKDSEPAVRRAAAWAIQKIDPRNERFVPVLSDAMRAGDGRTMIEVGRLGAEAAWAVPTLIGLLSHESDKVRALAAQTLGQIGPAASASTSALRRAVRDPSLAVQNSAQRALDLVAP